MVCDFVVLLAVIRFLPSFFFIFIRYSYNQTLPKQSTVNYAISNLKTKVIYGPGSIIGYDLSL
uniref:Putative ovule protein n=1 Tax=Solanum chacoense TaxID=4108 RepID=A0A0V0GZI0_SOLCH